MMNTPLRDGIEKRTTSASRSIRVQAHRQPVQVNFPQTGAVPMIIATDTDVEWAAERDLFNWKPYMPEAE